MDFVTHSPRTERRHDAVWVIEDRLTKSAYFLAVRTCDWGDTLQIVQCTWRHNAGMMRYGSYIREIVWLHGVPVSIVLNRDPSFTVHFWKSLQKAMGTQLPISIVFHL